jgi:hypothetical protein
VQWLPANELSVALRRWINRVFRELGGLLYRRRYFGFANFDFLADDDDRVWVIECNPRMSAATPQLLAHPELSGGVPLGELFLRGFQGGRRWARGPAFSPLPSTKFSGATLDITSGAGAAKQVRREFPSWPLRRRAGAASMFSFAAKGQRAQPETTLATILADFRIYDSRGSLNAAGSRLAGDFHYT